VSEVAGKFLGSERAIAEMLEASQPCHESRQGYLISNDESPRAKALGSSETERLKLAQDVARTTIAELASVSPVTAYGDASALLVVRQEAV
jgi:hypothetical protein